MIGGVPKFRFIVQWNFIFFLFYEALFYLFIFDFLNFLLKEGLLVLEC